MNVRYAALSEPGQRRSENQDSVLAVGSDGAVLLVVADGVGGLSDGAQASQATVRGLEAGFRRDGGAYTGERMAGDLSTVNQEIVETRTRTEGRLSGSTVVAVLFDPGGQTFVVAHVGDSRAYLFRDGSLRQLTEDHSLVAEQVRAGILTDEEAAASRHRHIITRSLGIEPELEVELQEPAVTSAGDRFLLCSDGLSDVVSFAGLQRVLAARRDETETARELAALANEGGGPDNISVIVADVEGD